MGLCGVIGAQLRGAKKIILLSHHEDRAKLGCEFGAVSAIEQAGKIARPGAIVGRVGVPQTEPSANTLFWKNIGLRGGIANVTTYDKQVLLKGCFRRGD